MNKKHFTATGVILRDNKILTIWHEKLKVWLPPGGHVEKNETPEEALIRECIEEIESEIIVLNNGDSDLESLEVKVLNNPYCILLEPINDILEAHNHIDFIYLCKLKEDNININKKINYNWVSLEEIDNLNTFDNVKKLFRKILESMA